MASPGVPLSQHDPTASSNDSRRSSGDRPGMLAPPSSVPEAGVTGANSISGRASQGPPSTSATNPMRHSPNLHAAAGHAAHSSQSPHNSLHPPASPYSQSNSANKSPSPIMMNPSAEHRRSSYTGSMSPYGSLPPMSSQAHHAPGVHPQSPAPGPRLPGVNSLSPPIQSNSPANANSGPANSNNYRSNPMSVSSMLSGPSRDRAPYSAPTSTNGAPDIATSTPQPPVLPPQHSNPNHSHRIDASRSPVQSHKRPNEATQAPLANYGAPPAKSSREGSAGKFSRNSGDKIETLNDLKSNEAANNANSGKVERSYPPLPSAFARESPYSNNSWSTPNRSEQNFPSANNNTNSTHTNISNPTPKSYYPNLNAFNNRSSATATAHRHSNSLGSNPSASFPPTFPWTKSAVSSNSGQSSGAPGSTQSGTIYSAKSTQPASSDSRQLAQENFANQAKNLPPPINSTSNNSLAAETNSHKRRKSEGTTNLTRPEVNLAAAEPKRTKPSVPPFTATQLRQSLIRPPLLAIRNGAVHEAIKLDKLSQTNNKRAFLGQFVYDPTLNPAKLLDAELLRRNVGATVKIAISSGYLDSLQTNSVMMHVCNPNEYSGEAVPGSDSLLADSLPASVWELDSIRHRKIWGTDVYTDDSDVVAIALHSGWLRLATKKIQPRAGDSGAGFDALERAKTVGPGLYSVSENEENSVGIAAKRGRSLIVSLTVCPNLIRYQGCTRQGIKSRNWGNGHDGVSLMIQGIEIVEDFIEPHGILQLKRVSSQAFTSMYAKTKDQIPSSALYVYLDRAQKPRVRLGY